MVEPLYVAELEVADHFDEDGELELADGAQAFYLDRQQVNSLRDHLTAVLEEDKEA